MNIYVGNLSRDLKEDELRKAFEAFGEVDSVNIIKDRFGGESRGFGFVIMRSQKEAESAVEGMNNKELNGLNITVSEAHSRSGNRRRDYNKRGGGPDNKRGGRRRY